MAPKPKKTVSISAIFKGHGGPKMDNLKDYNHSNKITKSNRSRKHGKIFEHALAKDFSGLRIAIPLGDII